jgi:predicted phosphodiesterase
MSRKDNRPTAILTADLHIRTSSPLCRTDDFLEAQRAKFETLAKLQSWYNCPILCAGDLTNKWNSSPETLSLAFKYLMGLEIVAVPGNHDLPAHNLNRLQESAYWTLVCGEVVTDLSDGEVWDDSTYEVHGYPYGEPLRHTMGGKTKVALVHHYVYKGRKPFPGQLKRVTDLMDSLKGYKLIITGDNHIPFSLFHNGQWLVNPGSFTRQKANEQHRPRVYLWFAKNNKVEPYYFKTDPSAISNAHLKEKKMRDERINRFIDKLGGSLQSIGKEKAFEDKIKRAIIKSKPPKLVEEKIWEAMENEER